MGEKKMKILKLDVEHREQYPFHNRAFFKDQTRL